MKKIAVIGNIFVDVKGMAFGHVHKDAKNVGKVFFRYGGVGRNIAQNLSVLGLKTTFVSSITDNAIGLEVVEQLEYHGVSTEHIKSFPEDGMGLWLAILDGKGNLVASISHQPNFEYLEQTVIHCIEAVVCDHDAVALHMDLTYAITHKVIHTCKQKNKPLYGIAGNLKVLNDHIDLLEDINCFICSEEEASILLNREINTVEAGLHAAEALSMKGAPLTIITLGDKGSVFYEKMNGTHGHFPAPHVEVTDSTGAGDAFFSGAVAALLQGDSIDKALQLGTSAAAKVIQTKENALGRQEIENH